MAADMAAGEEGEEGELAEGEEGAEAGEEGGEMDFALEAVISPSASKKKGPGRNVKLPENAQIEKFSLWFLEKQ